MTQPRERENIPPQTDDPLRWCRNMLPHPKTPSQHPGGSETPRKLHFPSQGAGAGSAAGTNVPGRRPEGTEKGALDPVLKEEPETEVGAPFGGAQVADDGVGCHSLDEGSLQRWHHFRLSLPSPSWLLCRHNQVCFFCAVPTTEQVLDPAHGKEARGRHTGMGNAHCSVPLGRLSGGSGKASLLIVPAAWAEPSATLKILPRSIGPPGCERQLPGHREVWGWLLFPPAMASRSVRGHP